MADGGVGAVKGNHRFHDDNLAVLQGGIDDAPADLIYLDPPLNPNASDNVPVKPPFGRILGRADQGG